MTRQRVNSEIKCEYRPVAGNEMRRAGRYLRMTRGPENGQPGQRCRKSAPAVASCHAALGFETRERSAAVSSPRLVGTGGRESVRRQQQSFTGTFNLRPTVVRVIMRRDGGCIAVLDQFLVVGPSSREKPILASCRWPGHRSLGSMTAFAKRLAAGPCYLSWHPAHRSGPDCHRGE